MTLLARASAPSSLPSPHRPGKLLALGLLLASGVTALGQSVILPPTAVSNTPLAVSAQNPPSDSTPPSLSANSPLQWGFVSLHPHFFYRFLYGDGLQSNPGTQIKTSINSFSPGVLANIGTRWTVDYTPTKTYYSDKSFEDTLDHSFRLLGGTTYENWAFNVSQTFNSSSTPLIETGRQTSEDAYSTALGVDYRFNDRVQLDSTLSYQARFTTIFPDSRETSLAERLHYRFAPRIDASVNLEYGDINMSDGIDMTYTRPGVQVVWKATDKTSLNLQAGYEKRRFQTPGASDLNSPTFGATVQYQPFTTTTLSLSANRSVAVAYFTNQVSRNTGWTLNLQQRLFQHYYLSTGYTGQKSTYLSTDPTVAVDRDDQNYSFNVRVSTLFFQRATVAVLYQNTHNKSNSTGFGFNSSQVGFELGYQF